MELVYLVLLLAALIAMNWRFVGFDRLFKRRDADAAPCRWRMDPTRSGKARQVWVCGACAAEDETRDGARPRRCAASRD